MIVYLLKSMLCLLILLLVHRLLLQREVLHRFNRFFLLAAVLGSFLIPLYTIEIPAKQVAPVVFEAVSIDEVAGNGYESFSAVEDLEVDEAVVNNEQLQAIQATSQFPWKQFLWTVYFAVSAVFLIRFLRNLGKLWYQIRVSPHVAYRGETLVLHPQKTSPFSFLRYIFVSQSVFEKEGISDAIFAHERCHVREKHSWDVLFIEALLVPLWFHPGLHFARKAIQLNHEFIADQVALKTTSVKEYQQQLLDYINVLPSQSLASSLNFSLTKRRLEMMNKNSEGPFKWLKILVMVPLIAGIVYLFSDKETSPAEPDETESNVSESASTQTNIKLRADGKIEIDGRLIEKSQLAEAVAAIDKESVINFAAFPGMEMGALADFQEILRKNDVRRVVYQRPTDDFGFAPSEKRENYYRNATFFVEDHKGEFIKKDFEELSSNEKSYLVSPPEPPTLKTPSPEIFETWENSKECSLWLDGEAIENVRLAGIKPSDIVFYFSTSFPSGERTSTHPQAYKVRLFTADGYENTFGTKSGFGNPLVQDDIFYLYPFTGRVNYGRTIVQSGQNPIDMYLSLYESYSSKFDGKGDNDLTEWEQAIGWQFFTELGGRYFRLSAANKKLVPRAKRPEFHFWVPLMKDGVRYYKKQNELTEEEKKQLPPPPPPTQKDDSSDEKEAYYRNAYILVEDENMDYARKSYGQLTEEEKKGLHGPVIIKPSGSPDPDLYEKWKDGQTYAIWIDGAVTKNEKLNDYTAADFRGFLQSRVMQNARSERFPQPFQVHMYTQKFYREVDSPKPLTDQDTVTLTQRSLSWNRDLQKYPDSTTAYLQKNTRYENLRTSGTIYRQKSPEEKAELDRLYQELSNEYSKSSDKRKRNLKEPIPPSSEVPRNGEQSSSGKISARTVSNTSVKQVVYSVVPSVNLQSNALKEYIQHYGAFQTKALESSFGAQKSNADLEALLAEYHKFTDLYAALSIQERLSVKRPTFPYARLEKDGKVTFKHFDQMTAEERKGLGC